MHRPVVLRLPTTDTEADVLARLRTARGFIFDMDGTLVLGDRLNKDIKPLPGAVDLIRLLRERDVAVVLLTNGTGRPPEAYLEKMRGIGFALPEASIITPSSVAADHFRKRKLTRVMVLGGEGVWRPIEQAGLTVVRPLESNDADAVYIGWHRDFTMDELDSACNAVWKGAKVFAASLSPFFATANGKSPGTSRAIAAAITSITRTRAKVLGKPSLEALRFACKRLGVPSMDIAIVGDDPELEVPMAHRGGSLAIAVRSGVGDANSFAGVPREQRPHLTVSHVGELLRQLQSEY
jgi:NagD protein